jgi:uncharacterized caspase-like protein
MPCSIFLMLLAFVTAMPAWAEPSRDLGVAQQATVIEGRKVALVVGNGRYRSTGRLVQAPSDAKVVATALRDVGFDVELHENLDRTGLSSVIVDFEDRLRDAEVGFFYYAGHAIQLGRQNFLVPVDADIPSERYVPTYTVAVDEVMRSMEEAGSRLNLLVLDACRSNPFASGWTSGSRSSTPARGLATINAPSGFIVAYATGPGDVAADDGTYAVALASQLAVPGREISDVFRFVHQEVKDSSDEQQLPWVSEARGPGSFFPGGAPPEPKARSQQGGRLSQTGSSSSESSTPTVDAALRTEAHAAWKKIERSVLRRDPVARPALEEWVVRYGQPLFYDASGTPVTAGGDLTDTATELLAGWPADAGAEGWAAVSTSSTLQLDDEQKSQFVVSPVEPRERGLHSSRTLALGAGASALAAAGCLYLAHGFRDDMLGASTVDEAVEFETANHIAFLGGAAAGVTAGGLMVGAVIQGRW